MFNVVIFILGLAVGFVFGVFTIITIALIYGGKRKNTRNKKATKKTGSKKKV